MTSVFQRWRSAKRQQQYADILFKLRHALLERGELFLGKLAHLFVVAVDHLFRVGEALKHGLIL